MSHQYPFFEAHGEPRELGRQHGEQAAAQIRGYLDFLAESLRLSREQLRQRAIRFQPLFGNFGSELSEDFLTEVAGLAEGANVTFADALALQFRGELAQVSDGACTTFAIGPLGTAAQTTFIGQTSDNPPELEHFGYVLKLRPRSPLKPKMLMWTFGGMLGYHGINSRGVAHFANALGGGPAWKLALSHYPLKRVLLEQISLRRVVSMMHGIPVCSNGNYMLADGSGAILDVELTSDGPIMAVAGQKRFLVHSNHYLCSEHACDANFRLSLPDSFPRFDRMRALIDSKFGSIELGDVKRFLSDHDGYPVSICRHSHDGPSTPMLGCSGKTVAALIAEPQHGRLHVALGNPCENPFVTYSL